MGNTDMEAVRDMLLMLGSRLADYRHRWTDDERARFDYTIRVMDEIVDGAKE